MRAAVEAIDSVQARRAARVLVGVACFLRCARPQRAAPDLDTKALCNRIEQQIKRLGKGRPVSLND